MMSIALEIPYWGQSLLRVLGGVGAVLLPAGTIVYLFLFKMMSFMQSRLGPMEAGPFGSLQLCAATSGGYRAFPLLRPEGPRCRKEPISCFVDTAVETPCQKQVSGQGCPSSAGARTAWRAQACRRHSMKPGLEVFRPSDVVIGCGGRRSLT